MRGAAVDGLCCRLRGLAALPGLLADAGLDILGMPLAVPGRLPLNPACCAGLVDDLVTSWNRYLRT